MVNCPECHKPLETIESRSTYLYWDKCTERYRFADPEDFAYCPECGEYIGDDTTIREILTNAD
jgi:uncharacterized protein YbaR (Trm112 family)